MAAPRHGYLRGATIRMRRPSLTAIQVTRHYISMMITGSELPLAFFFEMAPTAE